MSDAFPTAHGPVNQAWIPKSQPAHQIRSKSICKSSVPEFCAERFANSGHVCALWLKWRNSGIFPLRKQQRYSIFQSPRRKAACFMLGQHCASLWRFARFARTKQNPRHEFARSVHPIFFSDLWSACVSSESSIPAAKLLVQVERRAF